MTLGLLLALLGCADPAAERPEPERSATATSTASDRPDVSADLRSLEQEFEARVGVSALDTATGASVEYREEERFGFASTIKIFAAAEMLRQVPADQRDTRVTWTEQDVEAAGYSPVTSEHVADGLTLAQLAEAALRQSDNAATNLLLDEIGGPAGLESGLAALGDSTTRVVDTEPALNDVDPACPDNTTSPAAFTAALQALLEPENLSDEDRTLLLDWLSGNATGDMLIRAGAPAGWVVADKSGGAGAMRNDVAIVTPPDREPILITVFTEKNDPDAEWDDDLVARAAGIVLAAFE